MMSTAVEFDDSFEGVAATFSFARGWVDECRTQCGFAHLTEHLVGDRLKQALAEWHGQVSDGDGLVEAQSYPFHTEFSVHVVSDLASSVIDGFRHVRRALDASDRFDIAEIDRQRRMIDKEAALRRARGARDTWPWAYSRSIVTGDPDAHDSFGPIAELEAHATPAAMDEWAARLRRAPRAIGIAAHPDDRALVHRLTDVLTADVPAGHDTTVDAVPPAHPRWAANPHFSPHESQRSAPDAEVRISYVTTPPGSDPSVLRGMSALLAAVHRDRDSGVSASAGAFGPYQGPDFGYLYRQPPSADGWCWDETSIRGAMDTARHREVATLRGLFDRQSDAARLLSRDALFGLDARTTERTIHDVHWQELAEFGARADRSPAITVSVSFDSTGGMLQWLTSS